MKNKEYTLDIEGKKVPLLFSIRFWRQLSNNGTNLEEILAALDGSKGLVDMLEALTQVVVASGQAYATKNKKEFNYEADDVFDWFEEEIDDKTLAEMLEVLMSSQVFGKKIADLAEEGKEIPDQS